MPIALFVILVFAGISVYDAVRNPTIRRLALRNVSRRKGEALLVVAGSLLGTAIITASFIMGGTVGASIRDNARTQLGPADETIRVTDLAKLDQVENALREPVANTDGSLRMVVSSAAVATTTSPRRAEPLGALVEVNFEQARRFGGDPGATGFEDAARSPSGDDVALGEKLAGDLRLNIGDSIEVYAYGQTRTFRVQQILPRLGPAGLSDGRAVFVAPGTISALYSKSTLPAASKPDGLLMISNKGGVFSGADLTDEVVPLLRERVAAVGDVDVQTNKQDLLEQADLQGDSLTQLFSSIGAFSVIAGILLLINIFVMLSEERKSELGMLRAIGLKRSQLVRSFGMEGGIYAAASAIVGGFVGIAVGRGIVWAAQSAFSSGENDRFNLQLQFTVTPSNVINGIVIGGLIAFVTVWATSARIGRLNVIQAIRDLQDQPLRRVRTRTLVIGAVGMVIGAMSFASGVANDGWFGVLAGPAILSFSAIPLMSRFMPRRTVVTLACAVPLVWGIVCFAVFPESFETAEISAFVVQGVVLVSAAVGLLATNADILVKTTTWLSVSGRTLAARLAFAYPVARRFRTSMLLGMYAIVIFTITFISVFANLFEQQTPKFVREAGAGYDVLVESNPANPISEQALLAQPGVAAVAPLYRSFTEFSTAEDPDPVFFGMSGFDQRLLARGMPDLKDDEQLPQFRSQRATWEGVLAAKDLAIVSDFFLQEEGGPPQQVVHAGDKFTMHNRTTGEKRDFTIAAVLSNDIGLFNGVFLGAPAMKEFMGSDAVLSRYYVAVNGDPDDVATRLQGSLLQNGVDADSFLSLITEQARQQNGFFRLMSGYLGLGLVIGIAGLGVVMVRAVRERRRQIGMLRAMGFQHRIVRTAFLLEATFIALQGVLVGVVLALVTSYTLLTRSDSFGPQNLDFEIPWGSLAFVVITTVFFSVIAVLAPAGQASKIKPAVALRIAD